MIAQSAGWLARRLVRRYPDTWRARYSAEMLDLLERRPPTWANTWNLACHLLYTHLHPDLVFTGEESAAERLVELMRALRSSEVTVFYAFVAAAVAWLHFGWLADGGPYTPLLGSAGNRGFAVLPAVPGMVTAFALQAVTVDLAFVALLAGGLPLLVSAWRRTPALRWYVLVPLAGVAGAVLPALVALLLRVLEPSEPSLNLTIESPVTIAYGVWFVALAAVSAGALGRIIAAGEVSDRPVRYAFVPSALVSLALVLLLGATIWWGIAAHQGVPWVFDQASITLGHATLASWLLDVLVMASAALVAVFATIRGAMGGAGASMARGSA